MLVLSKNEGKSKNGKFFANPFFTEVLRYAKVNINKEGWHNLAHELNKTGLIQGTKNQTCELAFVDPDGETEIIVDDIENIISFFPFFCVDCGKELEDKPRRRETCDECFLALSSPDPFVCVECGKLLESKPKRRDVCDKCYKVLRNEDVKNNMQSYRSRLTLSDN